MAKLPIFSAPQPQAPGDFDWFVYGSSLDADAFRAWCGEHGYRLPDLSRAEPAHLPGWRLAFNVRSNFWGGVVASVVEDSGSSVEGLRIPLPAGALGMVRHKEGVVSGLYEERRARVVGATGGREAILYVAAPTRTVPEERPAERFLETLIKGAREHGLSAEWITKLESMR